MNFARRQQYRRLLRSGAAAAAGCAVAAALGLAGALAGAEPVGGLLLLAAAGLGPYTRHWLVLAGRSRVGLARRTRCSECSQA